MIDGIITPALRDIDYLAPSAPYPAYPSGLTVHENSIYRYSISADEFPNLIIKDYIPDYNGNFIHPGFYKLALSDDKEFLYLIETNNLLAVIPVFKLEENKSELKKYRNDLSKAEKRELKKEERQKKRKDKFRKVIETKYAKTGATLPPAEYEHSEATIEYVREGMYYLIKYEKGFLRAWGAIKVKE